MTTHRSDQYSAMAVLLHWITALLIIGLLATGFKADSAPDAATRIVLLKRHLPLAVAVVVLTLGRILWWLRYESRPAPLPGTPQWMDRAAKAVHLALYAIIIVLAATGIGTLLRSGALPVILHGSPAQLPDFDQFRAKEHHSTAVAVLIGLLVLHVAAAIYHQFGRGEPIFRRIWFSGKSS